MKFIYALAFLAICLTGCDDNDKAVVDVSRIAKAKYHLKYRGSYYGYLSGPSIANGVGMNSISISYDIKDTFDEMKARKLVVDLTEELIKIMNSSPIKNKMVNRPISDALTSISITFKGKNDEDLGAICAGRGNVFFQKVDYRGKLIDSSKEKYIETYQKVYDTQPPVRN